MSLFSSAFSRLFGCFTPFFRQREKAQQCAVQELVAVEEPPESETLNFTAKRKKSSKEQRKRPEKVQPTVQGKRAKLPDNCGDAILPTTCFQLLSPLKRPPVEDPQCASDELFSCRLYSGCPLSPITAEEPQHDFVLPGCPLEVPSLKVAVPQEEPQHAPDELFSSVCLLSPTAEEEPQCVSDELFSFRMHLVCPLSPIAEEEPQHEFLLPGCPLPVPRPTELAVIPPRPGSAPEDLFSFRLSSVSHLGPTDEEEPHHEFFLPGCPLQVLAVPPPRPVSAPDELFSSRLSLKRPLSPIHATHESTLSSVQSASTSEEEYEDDNVLESDSLLSELIELQDISESGDSLFCTVPFGGAESQVKVTVQNEPKSPLVQLSWGDKVKDWLKRKLQKKEEMRKAPVH